MIEWLGPNAGWLALALLGVMLAVFASERFPPEMVAIGAVAVFLVLGLLDSASMVGALANAAPLTIACMFVISAALVRTGAILEVSRFIQRKAGSSKILVIGSTFLLTVVVSAFMNNIPVVMILIPVITGIARDLNLAPSKLLLPLSYCAIMGGTCTLIGTSTNLVVDGAARQAGLEPFGIFEMSAVGLAVAATGLIYLAIVAPRVLPDRKDFSLLDGAGESRFITDARIPDGSSLIGRRPEDVPFLKLRDLRLLDVVRHSQTLRHDIDQIELQAGDRLVLESPMSEVLSLHRDGEVRVGSDDLEDVSESRAVLVEAVVGPGSRLTGAPLKSYRLRRRFGVYVVAVHRHGGEISDHVGRIRLNPGDSVLLEGAPEDIERMSRELGLVDLARPEDQAFRRERAPIAIATLIGVVVLAALNIMPIVGLAVIGVAIVLFSGCLDPEEAFDSIDWRILALIVAMLAIGAALDRTGSIDLLVGAARPLLAVASPLVLLALVYAVTSFLTETVTNNAVAIVITPVAAALALAAGLDPRPFVVAVMFAASASFATPIGYQTNTLVYGPGHYRFMDFVKIGVPLNVVMLIVAVVMIPMIWPLEGAG
ncbi:TrkA-like [Glycocaulis alkaliphilus]|uniref:TrkA-like n=1 Tax=Glycocaulis alkaliphilus TaxID=1434191 RepID=A0A3T0E7S0_9PROT|nr:SLC13 family permease [Glycocaulis alkaliphilus]AZU03256.1 TrkA-like [Glycocaulis alkaliphilus]GGB72197.1 sodium:sulfate symporter [Glycocaulis alkaliphilus]